MDAEEEGSLKADASDGSTHLDAAHVKGTIVQTQLASGDIWHEAQWRKCLPRWGHFVVLSFILALSGIIYAPCP